MSKASIVITHYGDVDLTQKCVESLRKYINRATPILIIAPRNQQKEIQIKTRRLASVAVEIVPENLGFAGNSNIGLKMALAKSSEYILLLNNDTYVKTDILKELLELASSNNTIGLISPKIYFAPGHEYHTKDYMQEDQGKVIWYAGGKIDWANIYAFHEGVDEIDNGHHNEVKRTDFATGCCMLIAKQLLLDVGFFDPKFFLYFEDVDLSIRAKKVGYQVLYDPKVSIWHANASSTGKPGSDLHVYYQTRNRLYFGYKYASLRTKKALFFESIRFLFAGQVKRNGVIDYYLGKMGKRKI